MSVSILGTPLVITPTSTSGSSSYTAETGADGILIALSVLQYNGVSSVSLGSVSATKISGVLNNSFSEALSFWFIPKASIPAGSNAVSPASGTSSYGAVVYSLSGCDQTPANFTSASLAAQSTPFASPLSLSEGSGSLIVASAIMSSNNYWTSITGNVNTYTNRANDLLTGAARAYIISDALNTSAGTESISFNTSASSTGAALAVAIPKSVPTNGIPSLTVESKSGTPLAAGTSVSVTVDTTTGTNVYAKTALTITSANQIPVIDLSSAVSAGTIANGDTVNYRVDYAGETTIVPQTVVTNPT